MRDFDFFVCFVVELRVSAGFFVEQQRVGVRRLLVDLHAHVVERGNDRFERGRLREVVGQVVVDVRVGQVTAFAAELDERPHLMLAFFELRACVHWRRIAILVFGRAACGAGRRSQRVVPVMACQYILLEGIARQGQKGSRASGVASWR